MSGLKVLLDEVNTSIYFNNSDNQKKFYSKCVTKKRIFLHLK